MTTPLELQTLRIGTSFERIALALERREIGTMELERLADGLEGLACSLEGAHPDAFCYACQTGDHAFCGSANPPPPEVRALAASYSLDCKCPHEVCTHNREQHRPESVHRVAAGAPIPLGKIGLA